MRSYFAGLRIESFFHIGVPRGEGGNISGLSSSLDRGHWYFRCVLGQYALLSKWPQTTQVTK